MNKAREHLIAELTSQLKPARGAGHTTGLTVAWLAGATVFSLAAIRLRAWSTSTRRMASAATAMKCARPCHSTLV